MKKIGIFLAFGPDQPIATQGLGRITAFLLRGLAADPDTRPVVVCPPWLVDQVKTLIKEAAIAADQVDFISPANVAPIVRLYQFNARRKLPRIRKRRSVPAIVRTAVIAADGWFRRGIASGSIFAFAGTLVATGLVAALLSPLIVVYAIATLLKRGVRWLLQSSGQQASRLATLLPITPAAVVGRTKNHFIEAYINGLGNERSRLVDLANAQKGIAAWVIPAMYWPEVSGLTARKVVIAPDIIYLDFPSGFGDANLQRVYKDITQTVKSADQIATFSGYVRDNHLINALGIAPDRISVIPHGRIDLRQSLPQKGRGAPVLLRHLARETVGFHIADKVYADYAAWNLIKDLDFAFYASHYRPYKNLLNLLRALDLMLSRGRRTALVTTADLKSDPTCAEFLAARGLEPYVLILRNVPSGILSSLYCAAACAINPTLFEGGFPFTFTEAYSVGTPTIMSRIPVSEEAVSDPALRARMLFDPRSPDQMAARWCDALDNREDLLAAQKPLYEAFENWDAVAARYVALATQSAA